jgi:peptide/nickel transport system permease protein
MGKKNLSLWIGSLFVFILLVLSLFGKYLPFVDAELTQESYRLGKNNEIFGPPFEPSASHILGTDEKGRDLFSMIVLGTRETLLFIFVITLVRYIIALPLGMLASKNSGIISTIIDMWHRFFTGLPTLFAAIFLINFPIVSFSEHRTTLVILIIALIEVGRVANLFKEEVISLSKQPYVESGIMIGNGMAGLFRRYYWPQLLTQVIVMFVMDLGKVMLLIGQLGILSVFIVENWFTYDLGIMKVENVSLSWPSILADARNYIRTYIWIPFSASIAIGFAIISFNLLGEGLRRYFTQRYKGIA